MTPQVIQGAFIGGRPRALPFWGSPAPASAASPLAPEPRRPNGRARSLQAHASHNAFAIDPARVGIASGGGSPLPEAVRGKMEAALGMDFSQVRVHVGPQAERIGAIAFTIGADIYFAPGRYQPDTASGQQLLGHELAHVVQQRQGRVKNPTGAGVAVVQDRALEAEADRLGQHAAAYRASAVQARMAPRPAQPSAPVRVSAPVGVGSGRYRLTARVAGREVGSVMVNARDGMAAEVTDLGVDPAHREQGVGRMLMASAARTGLRLGKSKVTLAAQDNGSGRLTRWYKDMGFAQVGTLRRGYPRLEAPVGRLMAGPATRPPQSVQRVSAVVQRARSWAAIATAPAPPPPVAAPPAAPVAPANVYRWDIRRSARSHYGDGWGATYGITTDEALKARILADGWEDGGSYEDPNEVYLGNQTLRRVIQGCNILYYNGWNANVCTTVVFHCGPTQGAG